MRVDLINPFIESVTTVLKTMSQTEVSVGKPEVMKCCNTYGVVSGVISMMGDTTAGNMIVSFDEPCILGIVNRMLMETFTTINDDVVDAVGEITNMICGGTKRILSEKGMIFEMATPMMLQGANIEVKQLSKAPVIRVLLKTADGSFAVESNLHTRV